MPCCALSHMSHPTTNQRSVEIISRSLEETYEIGRLLSGLLAGGELIGLSGPLGAGKTELVRGVAAGLGVREEISSPTYVLEHIYLLSPGLGRRIESLHHWDLYRLGENCGENEILDYRGDSAKIVLVEWPERAKWLLDLLHMIINIEYCDTGQDRQDERCLVFSAVAKEGDRLLLSLRNMLKPLGSGKGEKC